jgi:hypothetical protein
VTRQKYLYCPRPSVTGHFSALICSSHGQDHPAACREQL